jgi:hypothetical protein
MPDKFKSILIRWKSLENGDGLQKAHSIVRILWGVGLVLFIFVVLGLFYAWPPIPIVIAALLTGWLTAERNALQNRLLQWPVLSRYIDWKKVDADLKDDETETGRDGEKL